MDERILTVGSSINNKIKYIRSAVSNRGQLEMLAEECAELQQACLKSIRMRSDDTYPLDENKYTADQVNQNLHDEMMDVAVSLLIVLGSKETAYSRVFQNEREIDQRLVKMCDRIRLFDV